MKRSLLTIFPDIPLFVEVARQKSFTKAAAMLNMPVSTLSRRISAMEKELKLALFNRNSRNVELTPVGREFYERATFIVAEAENAHEAITQNKRNPSGLIRIALNSDLFHGFIGQALVGFSQLWPEIKLDIRFTERWVDLLKEPFDIDFRIGALPDSSLFARKLGAGNLTLFAAPNLLAKFGPVAQSDDLARIPCVCLEELSNTWTLRDNNGKIQQIEINARYAVSNLSAAFTFALAGMGVALLPGRMIGVHVNANQLTPILPGWTTLEKSMYIVMPNNQLPARVRLLVDYLVNLFGHDNANYVSTHELMLRTAGPDSRQVLVEDMLKNWHESYKLRES